MKVFLACLSLFAVMASASADEWGSWDDLPDDLLSTEADPNLAIDRLYDQLKSRSDSKVSIQAVDLEDWLLNLNLDFQDNSEIAELLERLNGESDEEIANELEDWLKDQLDDANDALEDELKEQEKEQDEIDDADSDEIDEIDDEDELDDVEPPEVEEIDS